jgi:cytochrome c-type biogenesis protein
MTELNVRKTSRGKRQKWIGLGLLLLGAFAIAWGVDWFVRSPFYDTLAQFSFGLGDNYEQWFAQQGTRNPLMLFGLSFLGGLMASISPCILSLLPVNLSYIGTRDITSRRDAFLKASLFVLGVVTVLSILGLFSALAGMVFIRYRGYVQMGVGVLILAMALSLAGFFQLPALPQWLSAKNLAPTQSLTPANRTWASLARSFLTGPFGVGLTFALVSSPCTSPIMFSVLAAAAATGSQWQSCLAMVSYALGYTAIIFLASLFTGLAKQTRTLLLHSQRIVQVASGLLCLVGAYYVVIGSQWILLIWAAS